MGIICLFRLNFGLIDSLGLGVKVSMRFVIVVIRGGLLILWQRVIKGRERRLAVVSQVRPVPTIGNGLLEAANDRNALLWDRFSIGVLVAHHDDSFTINGQLVLQYLIMALKVSNLVENFGESMPVLLDLCSVVLNITVILINDCFG